MEERKKMKTLITLIAMVFLVGCGGEKKAPTYDYDYACERAMEARCAADVFCSDRDLLRSVEDNCR